GEVPVGDDAALKKDLLERFAALKAKAPFFPDLDVRAVWLEPRLSCEVEAEGLEGERFKAPRLLGLVFPKKPKPARLPAPKDGKEKEADKVPPPPPRRPGPAGPTPRGPK